LHNIGEQGLGSGLWFELIVYGVTAGTWRDRMGVE
jgi:hypothetical protein